MTDRKAAREIVVEAREGNVSRQLLGWISWLRQLGIQPRSFVLGLEAELSLAIELKGLFFQPSLSGAPWRLYGVNITTDHAAPLKRITIVSEDTSRD